MLLAEHEAREWLDRRADRVERALASLSLPVRISGGQVCERSVRYHAVALGTTERGAIEGAQLRVAEALGAETVEISPEPGGLVIDIKGMACGNVPLLPLLKSVGELRPLSTVVGVDTAGSPIVLDLERPTTRHLAVVGSTSEYRSELLRTVVAGLALSSRPSALQFVGVDPGGKELCVVEALPHSLTEVAIRPEFAMEMLSWLAAETQSRLRRGVQKPHLVLVIEGVAPLLHQAGEGARHLLSRLAVQDAPLGVHMLIGLDRRMGPRFKGWLATDRWVVATGAAGAPTGRFRLSAGQEAVDMMAARASARDLNKIVERLTVLRHHEMSRGRRWSERVAAQQLVGGANS